MCRLAGRGGKYGENSAGSLGGGGETARVECSCAGGGIYGHEWIGVEFIRQIQL